MKKTWMPAVTGAVLLGVAMAPVAMRGQITSLPVPIQPNQPMQPGQTGGTPVNPNGGAGMAGAMTAGPSAGAGDAQTMRDKMFLHKAAVGGMAEVQLGQLASDKAGSPDVKAFAQKMVTDHTALNNNMLPFAQQLGVKLPKKMDKKDQAEYDKLNEMSGDDFDKEYLTFMVKDHHQDLREFRMEDGMVQDPALKAAVDKGFMVIREHTRMVDKLAKDKGLPVPEGRGGGTPATSQQP